MPFPDRLHERNRSVARGITQDSDGNIWIGSHDGVVRYNTKDKTYDIWRNDKGKKPVIYSILSGRYYVMTTIIFGLVPVPE